MCVVSGHNYFFSTAEMDFDVKVFFQSVTFGDHQIDFNTALVFTAALFCLQNYTSYLLFTIFFFYVTVLIDTFSYRPVPEVHYLKAVPGHSTCNYILLTLRGFVQVGRNFLKKTLIYMYQLDIFPHVLPQADPNKKKTHTEKTSIRHCSGGMGLHHSLS